MKRLCKKQNRKILTSIYKQFPFENNILSISARSKDWYYSLHTCSDTISPCLVHIIIRCGGTPGPIEMTLVSKSHTCVKGHIVVGEGENTVGTSRVAVSLCICQGGISIMCGYGPTRNPLTQHRMNTKK